MRVEFSKEFEKAVRKLSGKMLDSVREAVQEVRNTTRKWKRICKGKIYDRGGHDGTHGESTCGQYLRLLKSEISE